MISASTVLIIGAFFVTVCLAALYMLSIRINNQSTIIANVPEKDEKCAEEPIQKLNVKRNRINPKANKDNIINEQVTAVKETTTESKSSEPIDDEDDIIALAALKGYDVTGIRRKEKCPPKPIISSQAPKCVDSKIATAVLANKCLSPEPVAVSKLPVNPITIESSCVIKEEDGFSKTNEWSHVRTREEEAIRSLKAKVDSLQSELKDSHEHQSQSARNLDQAQRRVNLLEQESKEQQKLFTLSKASNEAQMASLNAINREMAAKLATIEADSLNVSLTKTELVRAKDIISRLQTDIDNIQEERTELAHQLTEYKKEHGELSNQVYLVDALTNKCKRLEESIEESRREFNIQLEKSEAELKLTRANLESEIAFHRAEHANSVGSSTALHQEIAQLKADVMALSKREAELKSKSDDLEKSNGQLIFNLEDLRSSEKYHQDTISSLEKTLTDSNEKITSLNSDLERNSADLADIKAKFDDSMAKCNFLESELKNAAVIIELRESSIEILKSALQAKELELDTKLSMASSSSVIKTDNDNSKELEILRDQLAEAEITISGLKSDLGREIKRADISKKVYEAKLSELKKDY